MNSYTYTGYIILLFFSANFWTCYLQGYFICGRVCGMKSKWGFIAKLIDLTTHFNANP